MEETYGQQYDQDVLQTAPARGPAAEAVPVPIGLDRTFGPDEITVLRHEVQDRLRVARLAGERRQAFVLAINEVVTNVVLHAGGQGRIALWVVGGSAWCRVTDSGPGIPADRMDPPEAPAAFDVGGRGIWLAHQLCDEVTIATGPIGTTIALRIELIPPETTSGLVNGASAAG